MNSIRFKSGALAVMLALSALQISPAQEPEIRQVPAVAPIGPTIGIVVIPFRLNTPNGVIEGVKVVSDVRQRPLLARNQNGGWQRFQFSPGADVILQVNGNPVRAVNDVRAATQIGWNTLEVWDSSTGKHDFYKVYLD